MNSINGSQSFDIRLTNQQLRRDAQAAMAQFDRIGRQAVTQGQRIDAQFNAVGRGLQSAFSQGVAGAKSAIADLTKNILGISALMASGGFIKDIYSSVGQFNKEMKIVSTISEDVTNNMDSYKERVLDMCTELAIVPATAAQALYQINSAGHLGAAGMKVLEESAKAAIGGVTETAVAADAITTILNAYKMSADDAGAVSDKLFTTVRLGKTTMDELGRSIAYVAPLAATYKISIEEVLAAVAQLTKQGNSTQNAMTQISASITAVANELGDSAFQNGLLPALEEIEKRSNGSNLALKAQLSNIRAVRGALGLTKENAAETAQMVDEIRNSAGATEEACRKMNSLGGAEITKLKNNFIKELSGIASSGSGVMRDLAKSLNEAFDTGRMQEFLKILGLIIATYGVYRGLLMASVTLQNASTTALLNAEYAAWQQLLPAKQANANADVENAMAAGLITEAKGAEIIALREEIAMKIAVARQTAKQAAAEVAAAEAAVASAEARVAATSAKVAAAEREAEMWNRNMLAAQQNGIAEAEANAIKQLGIAVDGQQIAAKEANTAATEANSAAKRLSTAQARLAAANEEIETLTHQHNTVSQTVEATSTGVLASAKRVLTAVTAKLHAVLLANPYMAVAAAVVALGYGIYKLCTYTSEAEKAQKAMSEASASAGEAIAEEKRELDSLATKLKEAEKGSDKWREAKDRIVEKYGKYLSNLDEEITKTGSLASSYDTLTAAIRRSAVARALDEYDSNNVIDTNDLTASINTQLDKGFWFTDYKHKKSRVATSATLDQRVEIMKEVQDWLATGDETNLSSRTRTILNLNGDDNGSFLAQGRSKVRQKKKQKALRDEIARQHGFMSADEIDQAPTTPPTPPIEPPKPDWKPQGDDDKSKGKTQAELNAEARDAAQKQADLEAQQARERARAAADAQMQVDQAAIDAMNDGAEKRLAQTTLNHRKEEEVLQRQMEDEVVAEVGRQKAQFDAAEEAAAKAAAAAGNKHYAKGTFNPGALLNTHDADGNALLSADNLAGMDTGSVDTKPVEEIMDRYAQIITDKRAQINREQRQAETDAMNEYLAEYAQGLEKRNAIIAVAQREMEQAETEGERMSIAAQLEKDLSDFDIEANKKTAAVSRLFEDMADKTVADLRRIHEQGQKALKFLTDGKWNAATGLELGITEETFNIWSKSPEELERIRKALMELKGEIDGTESGFQKLSKGLKDIFSAGNDPKKLQKALGQIAEGMQAVSQVAGFLQGSLTQLGEAFGSGVFGSIAEGIGTAMDVMNGAMQGAQAGAMFGPWGAAAGAAIGLVSSLGSALAKLHDARHERKIQKLQDQVETLEDSYDRLGKAVEKAYSSDASKLIEQQNQVLRQKRLLIQQQIAEEREKKNVDKDRIKDWEKQIREIDDLIAENKEKAIDAIFGEDVQSAIDNFAEAYESMFDGGTSRAKASKDLVKQMIKNMIVEAMKADISGPMERLRDMMLGFWSDNVITQREQEQLNKYADGLMSDLENKYGWADGYFNGSYSQSASSGGYQTLSEDTGQELNGRFAALVEAGEAIRVTTADINEQLQAIAARSAATASAVDEIRGMALIAIDYLSTISKHTASLPEMNKRLENIEKNTERI